MGADGYAAAPLAATLYTKPGCGLCDEMRHLLLDLQTELEFVVVERNIEEDDSAFAAYRYLIPVLSIPGVDELYPPHSADRVRQAIVSALQAAR